MDGSEIHEATLTLYFLDKAGAEAVCMAPDKDQLDVMDHVTGKPAGEKRNCLVEAARIARGKIVDVSSMSADAIDGIVIPGGFGAAKNLCTFARDGADCRADEQVARLLRELHAQKKPIGALCIAPALIARIFGAAGGMANTEPAPEITIGSDAATASQLEKMGATHRNAKVDEIVVDERNGIVTTPCYMVARGIREVGEGAEKLVAKLMEMASSRS